MSRFLPHLSRLSLTYVKLIWLMSRLTYAFVKVVSSPFKVFHICAQCFFFFFVKVYLCQGFFVHISMKLVYFML